MSLARERASTSSELRSGVKEQDSEQNRQLVKRKMNELRTKNHKPVLISKEKHPSHERSWAKVLKACRVGGFLLRKFDFFNFYMVSSCSILFTDFGTVFVFALG